MSTFAILKLVDGLLTLVANVGINVNRFMALRIASQDGHLSDEQLKQLADERDAAIGKM